MHCRHGCMDGIQPSPAQPHEDRTHPTGFTTSTCEHHARVGQDRWGRDSAVTTGPGSWSIPRQWFIPAGSRRQDCSLVILPSSPVATNTSIAPTRCDAFACPCARSQSPGLLQQHPGQRTKWLARTASIGSQNCSASGLVPSSSLASIRPYAPETSLAWHQQTSNFQAVRHQIQVSARTLSWLFVFDGAFPLVWFLAERPFDHRLFPLFWSRGYLQNHSVCVVSSTHAHPFGTIFRLIWESRNFL